MVVPPHPPTVLIGVCWFDGSLRRESIVDTVVLIDTAWCVQFKQPGCSRYPGPLPDVVPIGLDIPYR
jgi:hypothetical protein